MAKMSEVYSDEPPAKATSLWQLLDESSKKHADKIAVTVMHQPTNHLAQFKSTSSPPSNADCLQWTYVDMRRAALLLATGFHEQGVQRGTTLVTLLPNGIECVLMLWVSTILQLTLAPLDPRLLDAGREEQLQDYMVRLRPASVVVFNDAGARAVDEALQVTKLQVVLRVSLARAEVSGWQYLSDIASCRGEPDPEDPALVQNPDIDQGGKRIAQILFTSGTSTGKPKGCPRRVSMLLSASSIDMAAPYLPKKAIVHTPNAGAITQAFLMTCGRSGRQIIITGPSFSAATSLDAIEKFGVEIMVAIPVMSRVFEKELSARKRDLSALQEIGLGGDIVTIDAQKKFESLFPGAHVGTGHGMTECTSVIGWKGAPARAPRPQYQGIFGLGYAQPGVLARVCDGQGKVVPRGEPGELHLGGARIVDHYLENAQPESFYRDEKGQWMLTGDRAFMDEDDVIFIIGRNKDIIKKTGMSLSPAVAESVLNDIDGVEASVFGAPHPDFGEAPVAVVKDAKHAANSEPTKKIVVDRLGPDYALQDVVALADVGFDSWPLNQTGKIARHELKSAYQARCGTDK